MHESKVNLLLTQFWNQIKHWFAAPVFPGDENRTRRACVVNYSINVILILALLTIGGGISGGKTPGSVILADFFILLGCLGLRFWLQRGNVALASVGVTAICFAGLTFASAMLGTVRTPTTMGFIILVVFGGLVFDRRGLIAVTSICVLAVAGLMIAENSHLLPVPDYSITITQWVTFLAIFAWVGSLVFVTHDSVERALAQAHQELSERKRIEQELHEQEKQLRLVLDNSRDGINMLDLKTGRYIFMSPSQVSLTGFDAQEILGISAQEAYERVHPDDREISIAQQKQMAAGQDHPGIVEYRWKVKSGQYRWFSDSRQVIRDEQGQPVALVGVSSDITERKRIEEALRESENKYRRLFMTLQNAYALHEIIYDPDGKPIDFRFIDVNPMYGQYFGVTPAQLIGKCASELKFGSVDFWLTRGDMVARSGETQDFVYASCMTAKYFHVKVFSPGPNQFAVVSTDITEQKRAEEALRSSEARFRAFVEQAGEGFTLVDYQGTVVEWNKTNEDITGWTREQMIGEKVWDIQQRMIAPDGSTPEQVAATQQLIQTALQTGASPLFDRVIEHTIVQPNGEPRYFRQSLFPINYGECFGLGIVTHEITYLKQIEQTLRASEEKFRTFVEQSSEGFTLVDEQGDVIEWNRGCENITGLARDQMIGRKAWDVQHEMMPIEQRRPEDYERRKHMFQDALQSGESPWFDRAFEGELLKPDGERRFFRQTLFPVPTSQGFRIGLVSSDMTNRKRLEQELQTQREFAMTVMDSMGQALVVTNAQGQFEYVNQAHAKLVGYAQAELLGEWRYDINLPEELPIVMQAHRELMQGKAVQYETRIVRGDKTIVPVLVSGTPRWRDGKYAGTIAVITDLSLQKQTEEQLRYLGTHDGLTGLYNRGFFETEMARLQDSREYPVSILVADLDQMKLVNDTLGHSVGDDMLKQAAAILQTVFRASDILARIGGDEFATLLPKTDATMAEQILERIRDTQNTFNAVNPNVQVGLSVGVATIHSGNLIEAFKLADARMYENKRAHKS